MPEKTVKKTKTLDKKTVKKDVTTTSTPKIPPGTVVCPICGNQINVKGVASPVYCKCGALISF